MISEFKKLCDLFSKMDHIEGTTEGGRYFKITYKTDGILKPQIFENGAVYEPSLRISEIIGHNILSKINKIESTFFNRSSYGIYGNSTFNITKRKEIKVVGYHEEVRFVLDVTISNNYVGGSIMYKNANNGLTMNNSVPPHIPDGQRHDWLYLHYQKPENWISILEYDIKNIWYKCCGENIRGSWKYCHFCGKKQEVNGLSIYTITGTELLSKIT